MTNDVRADRAMDKLFHMSIETGWTPFFEQRQSDDLRDEWLAKSDRSILLDLRESTGMHTGHLLMINQFLPETHRCSDKTKTNTEHSVTRIEATLSYPAEITLDIESKRITRPSASIDKKDGSSF
jgi:hypothetical protein